MDTVLLFCEFGNRQHKDFAFVFVLSDYETHFELKE